PQSRFFGEMTMADVELTAALKQAKSKKMFFAFVPKGSDGKLIVSKIKIPTKRIAETKKEIGGGNAVTGKCFGDGGITVFQLAKALTVDGIMGSKTQAALAKALQGAAAAGAKPAQPTPAPVQAAPASPGGAAGPAPNNLKHLRAEGHGEKGAIKGMRYLSVG